jgi:hypothetical protein
MKCEDRERSLLLVKVKHPEDWPWDPGQEVGSQGVLFHRKEQGLWHTESTADVTRRQR